MSSEKIQYKLLLPTDLHQMLAEQAQASGRSLSSEIVMRLQHSLSPETGEMVLLAQAAKMGGIRARTRDSAENLPADLDLTGTEALARRVAELTLEMLEAKPQERQKTLRKKINIRAGQDEYEVKLTAADEPELKVRNKVIIVGDLGRDPEMRAFPDRHTEAHPTKQPTNTGPKLSSNARKRPSK